MAKTSGLGYVARKSPIHNLTGATKILMVVLISISVMITFDTRFLLVLVIISMIFFALSKTKLKELKFILGFVFVFMLINNLVIFLFSPEEGVKIYGTQHDLLKLWGPYYLTEEQLFYQLNVTIKYFSIMPVAVIFFTTTEPSEFASSLNKLGISYKIGYSVALALRYIPNLKRDFREISQAQQARGIDTSKKTKFVQRIKNSSAILFPLIFSSMDKIETISNAMELRSFGKNKKRTWYMAKPFASADYAMIIFSIVCVVISISLNVLNGSRFYNPFIH